MRLAHNSRTPLVSWRFLGINELSLALFPQEQPCRNPQQHLQCGCTHAKPDVPEETRSRLKSAFIPQKRQDLGTIWDKSQIFSNIWVQPAYKERTLLWCGVNPCEKASQRASQPQAGHKQSLMQNIVVLWTSVHAGDNTEHFVEKVPPSRTSSYTSPGTREPGMVSTDQVCAFSLTLLITQERNISVVPNAEKQRIKASGRKKHFPPVYTAQLLRLQTQAQRGYKWKLRESLCTMWMLCIQTGTEWQLQTTRLSSQSPGHRKQSIAQYPPTYIL